MKKSIIISLIFLCFAPSLRAQINGNFIFDGISRSWIVYLPDGYTQGQSLPLLLALHGYTQDGQSMMQFSNFNSVADTGDFVVVYPDGVDNSWNVGFAGGSTADDVGFLSALIDTLYKYYNVDLNRVYSTGFSNGGFMSYRLACEAGNIIAAIAPVSGTMTDGAYNGCMPFRPVPVMHIHGTSDFVVSYNGGFGNKSVDQVIGYWTDFNTCPENPVIENLPDIVAEGSTVQRYTWSPCREGTEVVLLKVINGGHTWPGSTGTTGIGITNRDIVASQEIWNFVKRFQLQSPTVINEIVSQDIVIYPNPAANGQLNIDFPEIPKGGKVTILNSDGRVSLVRIIPDGSQRITIDISMLGQGLHLAIISSAGKSFYSKFVVQ
ncbi:MAG: T9SS type A sorting domain-containing protein [Lentimicrobium sp.]|nr:T9SS type A sorting domain-containing protein [Lentimicrobium sp.]